LLKTQRATAERRATTPESGPYRRRGAHVLPSTAGVLEDAWNELQTEYDIQPSDVGSQDVHARSLKYSNPIDPTVAMAMKSMHGPKLEDSPHHPDRYYSPSVLSMTWHEPVDGEDYTTEKGS